MLEWGKLADALRLHAEQHEVVETQDVLEGTKYVIEGELETPNRTTSDRLPRLRSIWMIDTGNNIPRFVTAYPLREIREVKDD